jgi:mannitol/fructose-specific phosphotransferase system IIA component (Ntr-type)
MSYSFSLGRSFSDYGVEKAVFSRLDAPDKVSAVRAMVRLMTDGKGFQRDDIESMARSILGRQELGSTGIGVGVAAPHTRYPHLSEPLIGWFVANPPIDFEALDGEPVYLFFCLVSPLNQPGLHLRLMENCSALLKDEDFVSAACRFGIRGVKEYLHSLPGPRIDRAPAVQELTRIGVLDQLAVEKARLMSVAAEAGWTDCQAEMARVEAVLENLQARLAGVPRAVAEEGTNRIAAFRGCLKGLAAREAESNPGCRPASRFRSTEFGRHSGQRPRDLDPGKSESGRTTGTLEFHDRVVGGVERL